MGCFDPSKSKQTSTSRTGTQTKAIDAAIGSVPSGFPGYASYLGQGMPSYGGERVAGLTPTQTDIFATLPGFAQTFGDIGSTQGVLQPQLEQTAGSLLRGEMGAQPITPEQETAYFGSAIRDPRMKEFQQTELPGIQEAFAGPGYWGSARAGEVAEAYGDVGDWLGQQRAGLAWDTAARNQQIQEAQANRALGAIGPSMAVDQAPLTRSLGALGGMGATAQLAGGEQAQAQAMINADMQRFAEENQITDPQVLEALAMLIGQSVNVGKVTQSGAGLGYTAVASAAGGAGQAYGTSLFQQPSTTP